MSTQPASVPYMLLFRGTHWDREMSPEEIEAVMDRWISWFERLVQEGKARAGQPLKNTGKIVSGRKGGIVADGPFAEAKEAIAGYILLGVADEDEAVKIAKECPGLDYGITVEVRPVDEAIGQGPGAAEPRP